MPFFDLLASSWFGSLLGMRHALEPDHLAAVSTLVGGERSSYRAALLGLFWGLGHTAALIVAGAALVLLRAEMPAGAAAGFELLVAAMLIGLGLRALGQAARLGADGPSRLHRHGPVLHAHAGVPAHVHIGTWTLARRPLLIGAVHGLAGSGALTALVLTTLPSRPAQLAYVVLFGLGSTLGMAALSGLLGWPLARLGSHRSFARAVSFGVGCGSIAIGVWWGLPVLTGLM